LEKCGFQRNGLEVLYDGKTGEQIESAIFIGPNYYHRLKHMVQDKIHSRSSGPYSQLVRQPSVGRSRDGGLRVGKHLADKNQSKRLVSPRCGGQHSQIAGITFLSFSSSSSHYVRSSLTLTC